MRLAETTLVAIAVGNTTISYGVFEGRSLVASGSSPAGQPQDAGDAIVQATKDRGGCLFGVCSVNHPAADAVEADLRRRTGSSPLRLGREINPEFSHDLVDASTLGWDRVMSALAAFEAFGQACVVVQAGTAVTVDFVDGVGVFQGGAIAPGLNMMLQALHEHTSALPEVRYEPSAEGEPPQGRDTAGAMRAGVRAAVLGMVHRLIDQYAEAYGAYPKVVATGGDAVRLFGDDPMVDRVVPELQLLGIAAVLRAELSEGDDEAREHEGGAWREDD